MATGGASVEMEEDFPSMALFGDGMRSLADQPQSSLYFDVPDVKLIDPDEQEPVKPEEEENPYMSLKNCVLDMFKDDMADMIKNFNIGEIKTKVKTKTETPSFKKTTMLMSSIYRRQKSREESLDVDEQVNVLVVRNLDTNKVAFLKASRKYQNDLSEELQAAKAEVHWAEVDEDRVTVTEIKSDHRPSSQEDVMLWRDEADATVVKFFQTIMIRKVTVMTNVWTQLKETNALTKFKDLDKDLLLMIPSDVLPGVIIVGDLPMVANIAEQIFELVRGAEEEDRKQVSIHRSSLHELETWKLQYLLAIDISAKLSAKYDGLTVEVITNKMTVDLSGQDLDITKAKFDIQQILNNVERRIVEDVAKRILQAYTLDEFHEYIQGVLKAKHIEATFMVLSDELWVFAVHTMLDEATRIIKESVTMRYIKTDGLSVEVWKQVLLSMNQTTKDPFYIDDIGEGHKAALICAPCIEEFVMGKLREATRESALQTQRVQLERGIFLMLKRCAAEVDGIQSKYEVDITFDHAYCMVAIRGPAGHASAALEEVKTLSDRVVQRNLDLSTPGAFKFCQSVKGDSSIKQTEKDLHCVMEVQLGDESLENQKLKAHVNIIKGDIRQQLVDVIVNPVPNIDNLGRKSVYSVLCEAGSLIERHLDTHFSGGLQTGEVAVTSGGKLRCKSIFHCCVPQWSSDNSSIEDYQELIKQCLDKTDVSNYSSIAFPALGCEVGGFPRLTAASAFLDAILAYEETTNSGIKLVNIVVDAKDGETYDVFNNERNNRITGTKHFEEYDGTDDVTTMVAGIRIVVQVGELATTKADAMVNTTNQVLDLSYGAVSASILKAAGSGLQRECRIRYPQGLLPGQLAVSGGWKLACKNIYHCHLPKWMGNPGAQESLERIIDTCLELASSEGYETLAFPALGTGILKYPADVVAAVFKDRVAVFSLDNPLSCLREIIIVLYHKDELTCKAFSEVFEHDPELKEAKSLEKQKTEEFQIGPVLFNVKRGDLLDEKMDAIVVPTDNTISLTDEYGKKLIKTCGQSLMQETQRVNIKKSGAVLVSAKPLPAKRILFVSTEFFKNNMDAIVQKVFRKARKNGVYTLSIPHINAAIDTEGGMFAKALESTLTHHKSAFRGLKTVNIVMTSQPPMNSCISLLRPHFRNPSKRRSFMIGEKKTDARKRTSVYYTKSEVMSVSDGPHLRMLGMDETSLQQCEEKMKFVISENSADETMTNNSLKSLKQNEIGEVMSVCQELDVDVKLDLNGGKLQLHGIKTDVYAARKSIEEIIKKTEFLEVQKVIAKDIQTKIQWFYKNPSNIKYPFTSFSNMCIEKAFTKGQRSLPLHFPGQTVVLDFANMTLSLSHAQSLPLIREEH